MRNHLKLVKVYVKGKRTQSDLGEFTFGRVVSSDSSGGSPSPYICRDRHDCIWTKLPWGRVVLGINDKTLFRWEITLN